MKKLLLIFISASLLLSFCACGANSGTTVEPPTDESHTDAATEKATKPSGNNTGNSSTPDKEDSSVEGVDYYKNPIIKVGDSYTWQSYGVGDPFVMRYNGRYYLYCSTKDGMVGIQCWTSDDLVNWEYSGLCAEEDLTKSAYAPEVVYYNGSFYMYTSPAGDGHYVLKSDSPTGPFVAVTGNFGLSIDGDVFIDDDGSWYFYSAASDGIMVYTMNAPDKVNSRSGVKIPCDMHGWTEGSMIVKHNGLYYMTYTGNHVWTAGYRINYAVSDESPLKFESVDNNPLLLSTDKSTVMGIGHSSTVLGPNLDEYYIVYHSYKTVPMRNMNIDRIVFNGTETVVLGATTSTQQMPSLPDLYSRFESEEDLSLWNSTSCSFDQGELIIRDGGTLFSKQSFEGNYTFEINIKSMSGNAGFVFDYIDQSNYAKAVYCGDSGILKVSFIVDGEETSSDVAISASFEEALNTNALISFTVRKADGKYTIFVNNREVYSTEEKLSGGAIGVICESGVASVGFVGVTNGALQSTLSSVHKPVEATIPAFTCSVDASKIKIYDKAQYVAASTGDSLEYKVNVNNDGLYDLVIDYRSSEPCVIEIYQNTEKLGEVSLSESGNKLARIAGRNMTLDGGRGTVTLKVKSGSADLLNFSFHKAEELIERAYDFEKAMKYVYLDGSWKLAGGRLVLDGSFGKYMIGSENWSNYTVKTDITITSDNANAGLCVRVSNPATYLENNISAGSDYLQGYYIGLTNGYVVLGKHNYDWKELSRVSFEVKKGQNYQLEVEAVENELRISIDGVLVMTYVDNESPFLHGMVGYRSHSCSVSVDNLTISPIG